jgi:predicted helicase
VGSHMIYESAKEFPLKRQENKAVRLDWRVEAMKLSRVGRAYSRVGSGASKQRGDGSPVASPHHDLLTSSGIPAEVYDYRLGNRSALEWVIDQYRVTRDEQGNPASDPNRLDDEEYIVRLIGQVITVSLETMKVVKNLPEVKFE